MSQNKTNRESLNLVKKEEDPNWTDPNEFIWDLMGAKQQISVEQFEAKQLKLK